MRGFLKDPRVQVVAVCDLNRMSPGYWNGAMTFIEPMVTRDMLLSKQSFELPIGVPQTFGRAARWIETRWYGSSPYKELIAERQKAARTRLYLIDGMPS